MIKPSTIPLMPKILHQYKGQPTPSYGLATVEECIKEAGNEMKSGTINKETIKNIKGILLSTIQWFNEKKSEYTKVEKDWFLKKKQIIDKKLQALVKKYESMVLLEEKKKNRKV